MKCFDCNGSGTIPDPGGSSSNFIHLEPCPRCKGTGIDPFDPEKPTEWKETDDIPKPTENRGLLGWVMDLIFNQNPFEK